MRGIPWIKELNSVNVYFATVALKPTIFSWFQAMAIYTGTVFSALREVQELPVSSSSISTTSRS